jgi:hypothetical protein
MTDSTQRRPHIPEDVAETNVKLDELRMVLSRHTERFSKLETRLAETAANFALHAASVDRKLDEILRRLPPPR